MKYRLNFYFLLWLLPLFFNVGCESNSAETNAESDSYYTCPMHPTVKSNSPGACPVCNMSLIKAQEQAHQHTENAANTVTLTARQQALGGILIDTLKQTSTNTSTAILGTVSIDKEQQTTINSRVNGRIDKLFIKTSGEIVQKGNPVYSIYSEQLLADEKEYILLLEQKPHTDFIIEMLQASKNKLLLWGLTTQQIVALETTKKTDPLVTFFAQESGYVFSVNVQEGAYVNEGTPLIQLSKLTTVWVEVQLYADEIAKINTSNFVTVYSEFAPNELYIGKLVYTNPTIEKNKKIHLMRVRVENKYNKLFPGMMVFVAPQQQQKVLTINKSAIIRGKMNAVWVKTSPTTFEQRMVELGAESSTQIEIISGVKENEAVVIAGSYLINSEFILKNGATQVHQH